MSWSSLKKQYGHLIDNVKENKEFINEWRKFKTIANKISKSPPTAILDINISLKSLEKQKNKEDINIFDHGCGSGFKLMYLAAIGYKNIFGVNVNQNIEFLNIILNKIFKISEKRFFTTKGKKVPFKSNKFDFIISSQVLEHVKETDIITYYSEEGRILKKNGLIYHELPHLFIPYESHTRLWLIHLFPYFLKPALYGIFQSIKYKKNLLSKGSYYANFYSNVFLILRSPYYHKKMLLKYIGEYKDLTEVRLSKDTDFSSYDPDSPLGLRKIIHRVFMLPFVGKIIIKLCKNFFILQTLTKKS